MAKTATAKGWTTLFGFGGRKYSKPYLRWNGTATLSWTAGTPAAYNLSQLVDASGTGTLTYSIALGSLPAGVTLNTVSGLLSYDGSTSGNVSGTQFRVSDGTVSATSGSFTFSMSGAVEPPPNPDYWPPATITVAAGQDLQDAINLAVSGDVIEVEAGATFTPKQAGPYYGAFVLPYKAGQTDYITIRTSGYINLPSYGGRVSPSHGAYMPKLVDSTANIGAILIVAQQAHHWKLIGLNITNVSGPSGIRCKNSLVTIGNDPRGDEGTYGTTPQYITIDRCWIHEATNDTSTSTSYNTTATRGLLCDAVNFTIIGCRVAGFRTYFPTGNDLGHNPYPSTEASNAILFPRYAQHGTVQNCHLEAHFCNVFWGGSSNGDISKYATISNCAFDTGTHLGSATFSNTTDLSVGMLISLKTTGGVKMYPDAGSSTAYQVAKVTNISGSTVSFQAWGSFMGSLNGGNPLLQTPDDPGQANWGGEICHHITLSKCDIIVDYDSMEAAWIYTGGSSTSVSPTGGGSGQVGPKCYIEMKQGDNMTIEGCIFSGWSTIPYLTSKNQSTPGGAHCWYGVSNVTFRNNWVKRSANWFRNYNHAMAVQCEDIEYTTDRKGNVTITNNLFDVGAGYFFDGWLSSDGLTVTHNTYPGYGSAVGSKGSVRTWNPVPADSNAATCPINNVTFKDNIFPNNESGMTCAFTGGTGCWPSMVFSNNLIYDNRTTTSIALTIGGNNVATSFAAIGFTDASNADYSLSGSSSYKNTASDGGDPGCNMATLATALGVTPSPSYTPQSRP